MAAGEQLALAEQTVWEMLHQGRLAMSAAGQPVPRERWQAFVLSWESWAGGASRRAAERPAAGREAAQAITSAISRSPLVVGGEQIPVDPQQPGDVVDVLIEMGDEQQRRTAEFVLQPGGVARVTAGQPVIVGEVLGHPSGKIGGAALCRDSATRSCGSASPRMSWWTRLTITPANGRPLSVSVRRNQIASSIADRWAEVTSTKAVVSA